MSVWSEVFNPKRELRAVMEQIRPLLAENGMDMAGFDDLYGTVCFSPPEGSGFLWGLLAEELTDALPEPKPGAPAWVLKVADIIAGRA